MSLIQPTLATALSDPQRVAVVDDVREYTFGDLIGGALYVAKQIAVATDNPHVGLMLPTGGLFPMSLFGAWAAGRVVVPLNYLLSPDELAYVIGDSGIDTIITSGKFLEHLASVHDDAQLIPPNVNTILAEDLDPNGAMLPELSGGDGPGVPSPDDDDLAAILYTSGTSGRPKGVMLSHGNLHSNVEDAIEHAQFTDADTFLGVLPQFHSFGLTALTLLPMCVGSKVVYSSRFMPKRIVNLIRKHKPRVIMAVPSMYGALLAVKSASAEDFESVRMAVSGGEPLPNATFEAFNDRFNVRLLEGYGLTETSPISNWSTLNQYRRGAVGRSIPRVSNVIVDEKDQVLPPNEEGEILISGPNIMKGYFKLPQQTDEVFVDLDADGNGPQRHFRTGDIGRVDDEGFLYITGRKKEMLIVGGENVFPREIEEVLNKHESVRDSAVIGKTDGMRGEVPIAFVEMNDGADFDDKVIRTWCRDNLAGYKVPREINVVDALPRNPTGKIMRRKLSAD